MSEPRRGPVAPYSLLYDRVIRRALEEDLGEAGDLTTDAIVPAGRQAAGRIVARSAGRIAGVEVSLATFRFLDPRVEIDLRLADGADAESGEIIALVLGPARPILSAERTALNLLGRLSGIAMATRVLVGAIAGFPPGPLGCATSHPAFRS